jgi:hypothetical protein
VLRVLNAPRRLKVTDDARFFHEEAIFDTDWLGASSLAEERLPSLIPERERPSFLRNDACGTHCGIHADQVDQWIRTSAGVGGDLSPDESFRDRVAIGVNRDVTLKIDNSLEDIVDRRKNTGQRLQVRILDHSLAAPRCRRRGSKIIGETEGRAMRWEYRVVTFSGATFDDLLTPKLNALGEDGWDIVSMSTYASHSLLIFVFNRPRNMDLGRTNIDSTIMAGCLA